VAKRRLPAHPAVRAFSLPKIEYIRRTLGAAPGQWTMLEVGAGNGFFSAGLSEIFHLTALDLSRNMLLGNPAATSRKIQGDAEYLPFESNSFDVVFCANLLHHIESPNNSVREMARVARRHVVLVEPNTLNPLMALFGLLVSRERGTLRFTARYLKELGRKADLRIRKFSTQGMVVPNKTPTLAVALLRQIDVPNPMGFYHVAVFDV
jgi:ubiquinone/menaquinone biosynthesis C-methylase UbiE